MTDLNSNNERRKSNQRRRVDLGPPPNIGERRINIERRLFNLGLDCGEEWLNASRDGSSRRNKQ